MQQIVNFIAKKKWVYCIDLNIIINVNSYNPIYFDTVIQDEGPGIEEERIASMFNVFGELFETQSMKLVKHNSIGIGLNCSQLLAKSLNGHVILLDGKAGVFAI